MECFINKDWDRRSHSQYLGWNASLTRTRMEFNINNNWDGMLH